MAINSSAQNASVNATQKALEQWGKDLAVFGRTVPQEEVFLHMDNTGYYIGDTIYFKAYMRLSTGQPTNLSELLYVELLDNDGYLVERQNIRMTNGQGRGSFVLTDSLYGGYYELRAYTRWQLNWGRYEHNHSIKVHKWFYSNRMMDEYFRDYEKLYSRVFPVYDKPMKAGEYNQQMSLRPLQRYFKQKVELQKAEVNLYPEGGNLIKDVENRIAFEANDQDGQHLKGELQIRDRNDSVVASGKTFDRGRGSLLFTPSDSTSGRYKAVFVWDGEKSEKARMPKIEADGCSMMADVSGDSIKVHLACSGEAATQQLAMTVMCHGVMRIFRQMGQGKDLKTVFDCTKLPDGVTQLTVFSADGHVWADRLVFVRHQTFQAHKMSVTGMPREVLPYQKVNLQICGDKNSTVSLSIRDNATSPNTFDGANIMTELLLSSQIRGYVEQPDYYFESDDEEHHKALDLLLMVQGWRRYDWKQMATPGVFKADEPYEKTQWIYGEVNKLDVTVEGDFRMFQDPRVLMEESSADNIEYLNYCSSETPGPEYDKACEYYFTPEFVRKWHGLAGAKAAAMILFYKLGKPDSTQARDGMFDTQIRDMLTNQILDRIERQHKPVGNLDHEVTVHAEFALDHKVKDGRAKAADGDMLTYDHGQFRIKVPNFDGYCRFFCSASDQTKWKNGKAPTWLDDAEFGTDNNGDCGLTNFAEFYVRLRDPYPRFVKPYDFYQTAEPTVSTTTGSGKIKRIDDVRVLDEVVIGAKRGGARKFDKRYPAFVLDAYDAFNTAVDAGLNPGFYDNCARYVGNVAHAYIGDMNMDRNYNIIPRFNSKDMSVYMSDLERTKYDHLHFVDKVYIYTDYSPRREGDRHFEMQNQPPVTIDLRHPEDNSQYKTYRDRYKVIWGFSTPTDFYSPDYSRMKAPEAGDYRRTIYWNPDVQLGADGKADVHFYGNGQTTELSVSANGMDADGNLECN